MVVLMNDVKMFDVEMLALGKDLRKSLLCSQRINRRVLCAIPVVFFVNPQPVQ